MPECPHCCLFDEEAVINEHVARLHLDDQGQVIENSVVDKISNQKVVEVSNLRINVTVGGDFVDTYTAVAHPSLTSFARLVVYRPPSAMGLPPAPLELHVFERTSEGDYGDAPTGYELVWFVGEWSVVANGDVLTPT